MKIGDYVICKSTGENNIALKLGKIYKIENYKMNNTLLEFKNTAGAFFEHRFYKVVLTKVLKRLKDYEG